MGSLSPLSAHGLCSSSTRSASKRSGKNTLEAQKAADEGQYRDAERAERGGKIGPNDERLATLAARTAEKNERVRRVIASLLEGSRAVFQKADLAQLLDYKFFTERVQPILARPGADGKACVECHASHAIFKLQPPDAAGRFSEQASRENYRYALAVVDPAQPESSLLLIKPTRPTDSAADANVYLATHNGGQRWPGNESSPEYRVLLDWIRGARPASSR